MIFACQEKGNKETVFTLVQSRRNMYSHSEGFKYKYTNYILIENTPNDKEELKRLMIHHFLDLTSAIDTLQACPDLEFSSCMFLKSTSSTKGRFSLRREDENGKDTYVFPGERNSFGWYNNKTYVGYIYISRCKKDKKKLIVSMDVNLGTAGYNQFIANGPDEETHILLNECDLEWYEPNKDNELVNYFMELKNHRK